MSEQLYNINNLVIMVVDDHDPIRKAIKRVMLKMGVGECIEAFDGEEALKILAKKPIDLLICDLYMRRKSGFDVMSFIRNRAMGSDIPMLVVTGEASKDEIVKVADIGAEDYLLKPFQAQELEKKVVKMLTTYFSPSPLLKALRAAERSYMRQEFSQALQYFEIAAKLDPNSSRSTHGLALTLTKLGRGKEAIEVLEANLSKNHSYYKNYSALADIYLAQNRVREACQAMRKELEINPKQPERQIQLAKLLLKDGDALSAIDHYRHALIEDPKKKEALMGMGHALARTENLDKALYYFKRVRRYHPGATKALEAAVKCALLASEPKKAEMFLKDEKNNHPDRADAFTVLIMLYINQDREDEALTVIEELLSKHVDHPDGLRIKGLIHLKKRNFQAASDCLSILVKTAPTAAVFYAYGEALIGLNKLDAAMESLHRALTLDSENPQGFKLLAEAHKMSQQWIKSYYLYRRLLQFKQHPAIISELQKCLREIQMRRQPKKLAS